MCPIQMQCTWSSACVWCVKCINGHRFNSQRVNQSIVWFFTANLSGTSSTPPVLLPGSINNANAHTLWTPNGGAPPHWAIVWHGLAWTESQFMEGLINDQCKSQTRIEIYGFGFRVIVVQSFDEWG